LQQAKIIIVNNKYKVGVHSRGYRISSEYYAFVPVQIEIQDFVIRRKLRSLYSGKKLTKGIPIDNYSHLIK
jgi:hypothetical protein